MLVGLVTEIKPGERRCALTPAGARELTAAGHDVLVQAGAGDGSGFCDAEYVHAGARVAADEASVLNEAIREILAVQRRMANKAKYVPQLPGALLEYASVSGRHLVGELTLQQLRQSAGVFKRPRARG